MFEPDRSRRGFLGLTGGVLAAGVAMTVLAPAAAAAAVGQGAAAGPGSADLVRGAVDEFTGEPLDAGVACQQGGHR
ncbi:hypothetical protein UA75_08005 [Actinoalloteichus sp. GBA129-24]|uniref:Uncharacterized protein n=1 Tax=Actinoalloteichus fjordicus TaxID=1612552 RepID=A0AAC9PR30_9PSEU|nr:hypothetical protein UA74_08025 [Actinoalloteichus fjordicus]APU19619.1 hypothetical protein UA75_08005 [Actinoalloteichus sp. GBA129-24]